MNGRSKVRQRQRRYNVPEGRCALRSHTLKIGRWKAMTKEACVGLFKRADYYGKVNSLSEAFWREFGPASMSRVAEEKESPVLSLSRW